MTTYPEQILHTAQRLLQAVQKGYADAGIALPDRQLLYAGVLPPADYDTQDAAHPGLLAVGLGPLTPGGPGQTMSGAEFPARTRRSATLRVWLLRAVSRITDEGVLPTPDAMTGDAGVVFTDAAVLLGALEDARRDWTVNGRNAGYAIGVLQPVTVQGGYAGLTTGIDLDLVDPDA